MTTRALFPTLIDHGRLTGSARLLPAIARDVERLKSIDREGLAWSRTNYPGGGYTSYGSSALKGDELHRISSLFGELEKALDSRVAGFARSLGLELGGRKLRMSKCWVNRMPPGARHAMHAHPLSVVSGTFYVTMPPRASAIRFEDPRLDRFMARPPVGAKASAVKQPFASIAARPGDYVLFESWLRHEVPENRSRSPRVSVSFNYDWV